MVHSLYSKKDIIFLRELISNASDALDKLRFERLTRPSLVPPELGGGGAELAIRIEADRPARTLGVIDNGIAMMRADVIRKIGTIERATVREFVPNDIGRLGRPEEIPAAVAFLASSHADYLSGAVFRDDGVAIRST